MIPAQIVRFLERANVGAAGTRDEHLVPHGHRVSGWRLGTDADTLAVLVPEFSCDHLIESLEHNGQFSITIEEYPAHEAYQFKGRYLRHRPVLREDIDLADRTRERFVKAVRPFFPPEMENMVRAFVAEPAIVVEFEVLEIYVQTPGPGAGARLVPAETA